MNKKLKVKWIGALRSGEYKQWHYELVGRESYELCCLGVLCRVAGLDLNNRRVCYDLIQNEIGNNGIDECVHMNDFELKPFSQIADWIEGNL